jgi:iron(III) transport system substrate-binding protein
MANYTRRYLIASTAVIGIWGATGYPAAAQAVPEGYPSDYTDVIAAANGEGSLLVYTNMSQANWEHVIAGFNALYPGIAVELLDVGSRESIERYVAEAATGVATADLIATASQPGWLDMQARGEILDYASPETEAWPDWSKPFPGLYTISTDPLVFAWSALQVPEDQRARTFAEFAALAEQNGDAWANRITSYSPLTSSFGYVANWYFIKHHGEDGWRYLEAIGALPARLESTGGPQMEKVTSGEYFSSFFMSGITVWPRMDDAAQAQFLDWNYIEDGQPMMMRGIGIPAASAHVNAAKLMLDYILSVEGQEAFGRGGLTPARPGIETGDGIRATYSSVVEAVGEENIIMLGYDQQMMDDYDEYQARFRDIYER